MSNPRLPYLPALDGLRALAIIAVLLYHAEPAWLPGGFLGVDVFFVISAYLITALLYAEYDAPRIPYHSIDLPAFWARRARRLLPAVLVLTALALAVTVFWLPDEVAALRGMGLSAAGYVTNWYLIFSGQSYFDTAGRPSLLRHLWSLAVEEQFYLVWPPLLWGLLRVNSRRLRFAIVCAGIVASTLWMAYLYQPGEDPSRVYFGTDTRAAALLVGAALALVWSPWTQPSRSSRKRIRFPHAKSSHGRVGRSTLHSSQHARSQPLSLGGALALAALAVVCLRVNEADDRLYRGGLLGVALLSALAIAAAAQPQGLFARVLARNPLRWIGLRSYSLYLWHWPVFMLTRPQLDIALDGLPLLALRLALTLALAELSYRLVEMPARRGALGKAWQRIRGARNRPGRLALGAASFAALAAVAILGHAIAVAAPPTTPAWLTDAQREQSAAHSVANDSGSNAPTGLRDRAIALEAADSPGELTPSTGTGMPPAADSNGGTPVRAAPLRIQAGDALEPAGADPSSIGPAPLDTGVDAATPRSGDARPQNISADGSPLGGSDAVTPETSQPGPSDSPPKVDSAAPEPTPTSAPVSARPVVLPPVTAQLTPERAAEVTAIGDSVMLSAVGELRRVVGPIDIDAQIGRHTSTTIALLRARLDANQLSPIVIIQTGDNGYLSVQEMRTMLELLSGAQRVVFLNLHVPREWEQNNNDILRGESQGRPNVVLVDWSAASAGHPEYFWNDGMHLRPEGARAYATLVAAALAGL